eukprot:3160820-Rhodomonas_salina.3
MSGTDTSHGLDRGVGGCFRGHLVVGPVAISHSAQYKQLGTDLEYPPMRAVPSARCSPRACGTRKMMTWLGVVAYGDEVPAPSQAFHPRPALTE